MLVGREIIYAFLLVALLHSSVWSWHELTGLLADSEALFEQVYRWQRCGRLFAAQANLRASIATIRYYRPNLSAAMAARLEAALTNFKQNYPATTCAALANQIEVYRHDNDQLPVFWPNYAFRWRGQLPRQP